MSKVCRPGVVAPMSLFFAVAAVAIAGPGSVTGCFVGAVLIGLSQAYAAPWDPRLAQAAPLVVMALVLILRPAGLLARHAVPAP